jgi:hypothetical protein
MTRDCWYGVTDTCVDQSSLEIGIRSSATHLLPWLYTFTTSSLQHNPYLLLRASRELVVLVRVDRHVPSSVITGGWYKIFCHLPFSCSATRHITSLTTFILACSSLKIARDCLCGWTDMCVHHSSLEVSIRSSATYISLLSTYTSHLPSKTHRACLSKLADSS